MKKGRMIGIFILMMAVLGFFFVSHAAQTKKTTTKPLTTKTKKTSKPTNKGKKSPATKVKLKKLILKPNLVVEDITLDKGFITFRLKNNGPGSLPDDDHKQGKVKVSYKGFEKTYTFREIDPKGKLKPRGGSLPYETRIMLKSRQEVTVLVYFSKKGLKPVKKISLKRTLGKKPPTLVQKPVKKISLKRTLGKKPPTLVLKPKKKAGLKDISKAPTKQKKALKTPSKKSKLTAKAKAEPFISIAKVYQKDGRVHIVVKNKGRGRLSQKDYKNGKVVLNIGGKPGSWSLKKIDPTGRLGRYGGEVDFDTGLTMKPNQRVMAGLEKVKGDKAKRTMLSPTVTMAKSKSGAGTQNSIQKVQDFVTKINSFTTLRDFANAAKAAKFTESDMEALFEELKKPGNMEKIKFLVEKSKGQGMKKSVVGAVTASVKIPSQAERIKQLSKKARSQMMDRKKIKPEILSKSKALSITKITSDILHEIMLDIYGSEEALRAHISGHTIPALIGNRINISGAYFGTQQGRVIIIINDQLVECPVNRWGNIEINITLPDELSRFVGTSVTNAIVWVKLHGIESGPQAPIRLTPLIMSITSLSSNELSPGQELLILGENFFNDQGYVDFRGDDFGALEGWRLWVIEWNPSSILIKADGYFSGLLEQNFTLTVHNCFEGSVSTNILFKPTLVTQRITGSVINLDHQWVPDYNPFISIGRFFASLFGTQDERWAFPDTTLNNQWKVVSSYLNVSGHGGHGAEILEPAVVGSDNPAFKYLYWADGGGTLHVTERAVIEGPEGTEHGYRP